MFSCGISVLKWPHSPVRCKSPKHFSFLIFFLIFSRGLFLWINLIFHFWSYLLFFTWTFNNFNYWLAINLPETYHVSFYFCIYEKYQKSLSPVLLRSYFLCFNCIFPRVHSSIHFFNETGFQNKDIISDLHEGEWATNRFTLW